MIKLRVGRSLFREARAEIASSFIEVVIVHSNRSCNLYAHDLARSCVTWDPCAVPVCDMELLEFVLGIFIRSGYIVVE